MILLKRQRKVKKMQVKPQSDYLLCKQANLSKCQKEKNGLFYIEENIPEYEIVEMTIATKIKGKFQVGDIILSNAVPTKVKIEDNVYFLVKDENVIGKIY